MTRPRYEDPIKVRKDLDFGIGDDAIARYWLDGDPFKSRMFDAVQASFPDGERYFISAVRAFRDRIEDPALRAAVRDFMQQEGQHGRVHSDYNERLRRQGVRIDAFTHYTRKITESRLEKLSPEYNVAMTAAFEHFTAMMAELFFADKAVLAGADERVRAMFAWHTIEEMEHRAVAFDVMQQVAGVGYGLRSLTMLHASSVFLLYVFVGTWSMLGMDGYSRRARVRLYARHLGYLFAPRRGVIARLLPMLARYLRPGFHPNERRAVHNYADWVEAFERTRDPMAASEAMYRAAA